MSLHFSDDRCALYHGECLEALGFIGDDCIDLVLTDPPYGLSDHRPADVSACLQAWLAGEEYRPRAKGGFMGRAWDAWVPGPEVWKEAYRVLKPGGHVLAFAGTRSMDLMSMAIRLSGFELRDAIGFANDGGGAPLAAWVYGSGFPKSHDVSKAIDKAAGAERAVVGVREYADGHVQCSSPDKLVPPIGTFVRTQDERLITAPATPEAVRWQGFGTALKPAWEPIIMARKPLIGTVAENVMAHGTGALNIDACRVGAECVTGWKGSGRSASGATSGATRGTDGGFNHKDGDARPVEGRWPANLVHDGSNEVLAAFPVAGGQRGSVSGKEASVATSHTYGELARVASAAPRGDTGSAARFFYQAKPSPSERAGSKHPTVKPVALMRYLARLACPPDGVVLDPFCGSGTTMEAALLEGFHAVGMERESSYLPDIMARLRRAGVGVPDDLGEAA